MKIHIVFLGIMALGAANPAFAQGADVTNLATSCAACHGANSNGAGAVPGLRGKPQSVLAEQLKAFKAGSRPATVMTRFAKGYTDEEIAGLALHFSRLK